mmetsp:Transcript_1062/g.3928  ORF Transcript_1062/g.3928 Transcript_1062/m.3928 type:complete len:644 (-) Transcript_1062:22-1953(-)
MALKHELERNQNNAAGVSIIMSGGTEGVLSPHHLLFAHTPSTPSPSAEPRLVLGTSSSRSLAPHEVGRLAQVHATRDAVVDACAAAGLVSPSDAAFIQMKTPLLTSERVAASAEPCATEDTYYSMALSRGASSLGAALATGEVAEVSGDEDVCTEKGLATKYSSVASASAGIELMHVEVLVVGNARGSASALRCAGSVMRDAIDVRALHRVFGACGLETEEGQLTDAAKRRVVAVLSKADPSPSVRDRRTTMLTDSDINATRHARAAVGGAIAGAVGDARVYVSGGAEHQGPPGGGPICVIFHAEDPPGPGQVGSGSRKEEVLAGWPSLAEQHASFAEIASGLEGLEAWVLQGDVDAQERGAISDALALAGIEDPQAATEELVKALPKDIPADLCAGTDVALVGNSSSLLGSGLGARIDSHAAVIRFNLAEAGGEYAQDVGMQTTALATSDVVRANVNDGFTSLGTDETPRVQLAPNRPDRLPEYYASYYARLCKGAGGATQAEFLIRPRAFARLWSWIHATAAENGGKRKRLQVSSGLAGVALALSFRSPPTLYGFEDDVRNSVCPHGGHYFERDIKCHTHVYDFPFERAVVADLAERGRVRLVRASEAAADGAAWAARGGGASIRPVFLDGPTVHRATSKR